jgi:hypothetical protein
MRSTAMDGQEGHAGETGALLAACGLLAAALVVGGSSQELGQGARVLGAVALPLIAWGGWRLAANPERIATPWLVLAGCLVLLPVLQALLPVAGPGIGRTGMLADLRASGVSAPLRWTLSPGGAYEAVLVLLPALAVFLLAGGLSAKRQKRVFQWIILLAMASLTLGLLQLDIPQDSVLNPYPRWKPAMNGFLANPNHQATLLVVAAVLACGELLAELPAPGTSGRLRGLHVIGYGAVVLIALAALPLTGSRAGVVLGILFVGWMVAAHRPAWRTSRGSRLATVLAVVAALGGLALAVRWMQVDDVDQLRAPMRQATIHLAQSFGPWGTGAGTFVPVFEQNAPRELLMTNYVNHAHNELAQWLLEAGVVAIVAVAAVLATLGSSFWRMSRHLPLLTQLRSSALVSIAAVLCHSLVDYPLRTPAVLCVIGALAAVLNSELLAPARKPAT